jgi:hypothetical protein
MGKVRLAFFGAVFIALASGCGKAPPTIIPAAGVIRLDGRALKKVVVRFIPKTDHGPKYIAVGLTDESGHYTLTCNGRPGACAGENCVLVTEAELPQLSKDERGHPQTADYFESLGGRPLPQKYTRLVDSPLTADVQAGRTDYDFELTR